MLLEVEMPFAEVVVLNELFLLKELASLDGRETFKFLEHWRQEFFGACGKRLSSVTSVEHTRGWHDALPYVP